MVEKTCVGSNHMLKIRQEAITPKMIAKAKMIPACAKFEPKKSTESWKV